MSDNTNIGKNARTLDISPRLAVISKVHIDVSDDVFFEAGDNSGRTLTLTNPWGTEQMARNILSRYRGHQYQPMQADGAILDPAAEIGDGATVNGVYGGIFRRNLSFGRTLVAEIAAPGEEAIEHEFPYVPSPQRELKRKFAGIETNFRVQAGLIEAEVRARTELGNELSTRITQTENSIAAEVTNRKNADTTLQASINVNADAIKTKVSNTGTGDNFSHSLTSSAHIWYSRGSEVFRIDKNGAKVTGTITATAGKIGGFAIGANDLSYNSQGWGGYNRTGIYIGPSGIQLGSYDTGFRVDSSGNLYANSGYFRGTVNAGSINYGGNAGYFNGSGISGGSIGQSQMGGNSIGNYQLQDGSVDGDTIGYHTVSTYNTSGGINSSLGYANFANDVFNNNDTADWLKVRKGLKLGGYWLQLTSRTINGQLLKYVTWSD